MTATAFAPSSNGHAELARPRVIYIIGTYPLLTTTFIDREIDAIDDCHIDVVSLRRPSEPLSDDQSALRDRTTYARPVATLKLLLANLRFLRRTPRRYLRTLVDVATERGSSIRTRVRAVGHFVLAAHVASLIEAIAPEGGTACDHVHAHFVDRAATVAFVVAQLLDVSYSATAHANDIYVDPELLDLKLRRAAFVTTCTEANHAHLAQQCPSRRAGPAIDIDLVTIHHGLDLDHYTPVPAPSGSPGRILAIGQLKAKKGFADLLEACGQLRGDGIDVVCDIIGEGPLRGDLERRRTTLGLDDHVTFHGACDHNDVIDSLAACDVFALPCTVAANGDRDGIPNVILEAMAMQRPVVSTGISGIPEAVVDGTTGLLVEPGRADRLAAALARVLEDPDMARRMGIAGRTLVERDFDASVNAAALAWRFERSAARI